MKARPVNTEESDGTLSGTRCIRYVLSGKGTLVG